MNVAFVVNPKIVRGLDYYTNTAFEFINDQLGAQNSIAGGGRYNGLFEQIGGKSIPAIGFVERIWKAVALHRKGRSDLRWSHRILMSMR